MLKKLGKKIWWSEELWKVEKIFSPTKYDDYILISKKDEIHIHDNDIVPIEMALLNAHNDEFYPNTKEVASIFKKLKVMEERDIRKELRENLTKRWLGVFNREKNWKRDKDGYDTPDN